jgi:hypothetical protein
MAGGNDPKQANNNGYRNNKQMLSNKTANNPNY